ncbi:Rh type C glycoprotein [Reticulomyxa filosa]|uniref:Rh type C glycoprotein n=1 Tax=Reticulomyxa filosa TaxID=46433 RepID=X6NX26_RETFI|nr:Rh type C glycoprotein [Reticulomyxa filosa]|eukprot:ETO30418.1 Rh type C glycoprotein [Reticulomyxa filosa]
MYWPSFNAYYAYMPDVSKSGHQGLMRDGDRTRAYVNTILSLCAATMATFAFSKWIKKGKLEMVHIQNATLAGGVVMGACADLYTHPAGAVGIGFTAGTLSTLGYCYVQDWLMKIGLYDTWGGKKKVSKIVLFFLYSGVNNLHGMPGILGCIASAITVGSFSDKSRYYHHRDMHYQASYQIAGLCVTLGIAIAGGIATGIVMKFVFPSPKSPYTDADNFIVPASRKDFFRGTVRGKKGDPKFEDA